MTDFPIYREELAKLLGVTVQWCEDMRYSMPCARRVDGTAWWLSEPGQLEVWKKYADVWLNPPSTDLSSVLSPVDEQRAPVAGE
jgi:hypothetical protein